MIPFGNKTVTLLHKGASGYTRHILTGCSWQMADARSMSGSAMTATVETTCRIPRSQQAPVPGDLLILGVSNATAENEIDLVRTMEALRGSGIPAFRIQRVRDNGPTAPLPHRAAIGA